MRRLALLLALALGGCDDTLFGVAKTGGGVGGGAEGGGEGGEGGGDDTAVVEEGWCAVQSLLTASCVSCHGADSPIAALDLETDPYTEIVNQPAKTYAEETLVIPGDPEGSLLYRKASGTQKSDEGDPMPPSSGLNAEKAEILRVWIAAGASSECTDPDTGVTPEAYHPEGFDAGDVHGLEAKLQTQDCTECHGTDLTGGSVGVSCDDCHEEGWRTDCTFCHGGTDNSTGAPPRDMDGTTAESSLSFSPHTKHVTSTPVKDAFDCEQCHSKPTDVLSAGHLFIGDTTPGVAEMDFSGGLSAAGKWSGTGCSNLYCHGNGQGNNGTVAVTDEVHACNSCHAGPTSPPDDWETMSGHHGEHLEEGLTCYECHGDTISASNTITGTEYHVNGTANLNFSGGTITESSLTCNGTCHTEYHYNRKW